VTKTLVLPLAADEKEDLGVEEKKRDLFGDEEDDAVLAVAEGAEAEDGTEE